MFRLTLTLALASIGLTSATAQPQDIVVQKSAEMKLPKPVLALENGRWFDGAGFVRRTWYSVNGKLTRQRPRHVDARIDLRQRYVLPPLADAHNHNLQNAWAAPQIADEYLQRGIFYSAQLAANSEDISAYRNFLGGAGRVDVLWAEATLSSSDGHPLGLALAGAKQAGMDMSAKDVVDKSFWAIDSLDDLDEKWPKMAESRPQLIKVIVVDDAHRAEQRKDPATYGFRVLNTEFVPEIVARANQIGARVAAHVDSADDIDRIVRAGVHIIAHMNTRFPKGLTAANMRLSDETIAEMKRRGTIIIPTVAVTRYHLQARPENREPLFTVIRDNLTRLKAAGIPMLAGSDLFDGSVIDEIDALAATNVFTTSELLRLATMTTPRALFPKRSIGQFVEAAEASLVVYDANPVNDLNTLRRPRLAIKQGELIAR